MSRDDRIVIRIGGDMSGQFVLGDNNVTTNISADRKLAKDLFDEVDGQLDDETARAQLVELQDAVLAEKPDVSRMVRVRDWFATHLPAMAAAVGKVIVHPVVVRLVNAAGDSVAAEFQRHFGG
jgi:hypothetical protein